MIPNEADLQVLIGKVLSDEDFIRALVKNPEQALKEAGIEPTPEMLDALENVDVESLQQLAAAFGEDRAAV